MLLVIGCQDYHIIYLLIIILVPIIPSFVLFKFLPKSKAEGGGPFSGLQIKLSGAFGGYFLILLLLIYVILPKLECPAAPLKCPEKNTKFVVNGIATDNMGQGIENKVIQCYLSRDNATIDSTDQITDINGSYSFSFNDVKEDDIITVKWEDPKGRPSRNRYSPTSATCKITFKNEVNEN